MRIAAAGLLSVKGKDKASNTRRYRLWNKNKIKKGPTEHSMRGAGDFWRRITRQVLDQARATGQEKKYSHRSGRGVRVREYGLGAHVKAVSGRKKNSEVQKVLQSNPRGHGAGTGEGGQIVAGQILYFSAAGDGSQSLQGHAVHEGIMELNPVELGIWNELVREARMSAEWIYSTRF